MKVADLFGAGVPVLRARLRRVPRRARAARRQRPAVLDGRQLADVLFDLFETFPADQTALDRLRTGARKSARPTWEEGWVREAQAGAAAAGVLSVYFGLTVM